MVFIIWNKDNNGKERARMHSVCVAFRSKFCLLPAQKNGSLKSPSRKRRWCLVKGSARSQPASAYPAFVPNTRPKFQQKHDFERCVLKDYLWAVYLQGNKMLSVQHGGGGGGGERRRRGVVFNNCGFLLGLPLSLEDTHTHTHTHTHTITLLWTDIKRPHTHTQRWAKK